MNTRRAQAYLFWAFAAAGSSGSSNAHFELYTLVVSPMASPIERMPTSAKPGDWMSSGQA